MSQGDKPSASADQGPNPASDQPEYVKKMSEVERRAYLFGKLEEQKKRSVSRPLSGEIKERDDMKRARNQLRDDYQNTEDQVQRQREPAMIEAEAVAKISKAMHHPDRMEALLHSHIPEKILSNMGELESIERDAKSLYLGQVEDLVSMEGRVTRALIALKLVREDERWGKDEFLDIVDSLGKEDRNDIEEFSKMALEEFERQAELVDENWLWLEGIMQGVDDAFELALSAADKGRAEHAVKNIGSMVQGSHNQADFEAEGARSLWRKLKERFSVGQ